MGASIGLDHEWERSPRILVERRNIDTLRPHSTLPRAPKSMSLKALTTDQYPFVPPSRMFSRGVIKYPGLGSFLSEMTKSMISRRLICLVSADM